MRTWIVEAAASSPAVAATNSPSSDRTTTSLSISLSDLCCLVMLLIFFSASAICTRNRRNGNPTRHKLPLHVRKRLLLDYMGTRGWVVCSSAGLCMGDNHSLGARIQLYAAERGSYRRVVLLSGCFVDGRVDCVKVIRAWRCLWSLHGGGRLRSVRIVHCEPVEFSLATRSRVV